MKRDPSLDEPRAPESESERPTAHRRVPRIFLALGGLSLAWFVPVCWIAFAGNIDSDLIVIFLAVFTTVALGVPWLLVHMSRGRIETVSAARPGKWLRGQFETLTGRLPAREAAIIMLLPLASAAIGITALGIVLAVVAAGG